MSLKFQSSSPRKNLAEILLVDSEVQRVTPCKQVIEAQPAPTRRSGHHTNRQDLVVRWEVPGHATAVDGLLKERMHEQSIPSYLQ